MSRSNLGAFQGASVRARNRQVSISTRRNPAPVGESVQTPPARRRSDRRAARGVGRPRVRTPIAALTARRGGIERGRGFEPMRGRLSLKRVNAVGQRHHAQFMFDFDGGRKLHSPSETKAVGHGALFQELRGPLSLPKMPGALWRSAMSARLVGKTSAFIFGRSQAHMGIDRMISQSPNATRSRLRRPGARATTDSMLIDGLPRRRSTPRLTPA